MAEVLSPISKKVVKVPLDRIMVTTYVRTARDQERVNFFLEVLKGGGKLDPGQITDDYQLVDGRTRLAALDQFGATEMEMIFLGILTPEEIIFRGIEANMGGALPPSNHDYEHTIKALLKEKTSRKIIMERLVGKGLPKKFVSHMIDQAQTHMNKDNIRKAVAAILGGGLTLSQAAGKFDADEDSVRKELGRKATSETDPVGEISEEFGQMKSVLSQGASKYVQKITYYGKKLIPLFADNVPTKKESKEILDFLKAQKKRLNSNIDDLVDRLKKADPDYKESDESKE